MKGRRSVFVRTGRLENEFARRPRLTRKHYDFSVFADNEVEELAALAERAAAAGGEPVWSPTELAVLERLAGKLATATGGPR